MNKLKKKLNVKKKKESNMKRITLYLHNDDIAKLKELSKFNEISLNKIASHLINVSYEESKKEEKESKEKAS
jgi:alanine racemase